MDALPLPEDGSVYDNAFWGAVAALCGTLFAANVYVVIRSLKVCGHSIRIRIFFFSSSKILKLSFVSPLKGSPLFGDYVVVWRFRHSANFYDHLGDERTLSAGLRSRPLLDGFIGHFQFRRSDLADDGSAT